MKCKHCNSENGMDKKIKQMKFIIQHQCRFYPVIVESKDIEPDLWGRQIIYENTPLYANEEWLDNQQIPAHTKYNKKTDIYVGHTAETMDVSNGSVIVRCLTFVGYCSKLEEGKWKKS